MKTLEAPVITPARYPLPSLSFGRGAGGEGQVRADTDDDPVDDDDDDIDDDDIFPPTQPG